MTLINEHKLREIAARARKEFIKKNTTYDRSLLGACGEASVFLAQMLKNEGFNPKIVLGNGHFFVVCDGLLVDITASQFGEDDVVVAQLDEINRRHPKKDWWIA